MKRRERECTIEREIETWALIIVILVPLAGWFGSNS